ncbi:MAG TPA: hypothetical protein VEW48_13690 [Thermoanaerobaculia bacterium]|nr:hypothetical protein [Thermoanaerobaculia bacterium]
MPHTVWFRGLILVLILVLVAPSAFAAVDREPAGPTAGGLLSSLWQDFVELISLSMEGDAHGTMDPNGRT